MINNWVEIRENGKKRERSKRRRKKRRKSIGCQFYVIYYLSFSVIYYLRISEAFMNTEIRNLKNFGKGNSSFGPC